MIDEGRLHPTISIERKKALPEKRAKGYRHAFGKNEIYLFYKMFLFHFNCCRQETPGNIKGIICATCYRMFKCLRSFETDRRSRNICIITSMLCSFAFTSLYFVTYISNCFLYICLSISLLCLIWFFVTKYLTFIWPSMSYLKHHDQLITDIHLPEFQDFNYMLQHWAFIQKLLSNGCNLMQFSSPDNGYEATPASENIQHRENLNDVRSLAAGECRFLFLGRLQHSSSYPNFTRAPISLRSSEVGSQPSNSPTLVPVEESQSFSSSASDSTLRSRPGKRIEDVEPDRLSVDMSRNISVTEVVLERVV